MKNGVEHEKMLYSSSDLVVWTCLKVNLEHVYDTAATKDDDDIGGDAQYQFIKRKKKGCCFNLVLIFVNKRHSFLLL